MYKKPDIVTRIKVLGLEWAHYLVKTSDRTVKEVILGKPEGRRKTGRPRSRLLYCIECYLTWMAVEMEGESGRQICVGF
jgi:hypothetical protein